MDIEILDPTWDSSKATRSAPFWGSYEIKIVKKEGRRRQILQTIRVMPWIYTAILSAYAFVCVVATGVGLATLNIPAPGLGDSVTIGAIILGVTMLHIAASLSYVRESEFGGFLFYGQPLREVSQGLKLVPLGLIQLERLPRRPIQWQFPDDPERVYKGTATGKGGDEQYFALPDEERAMFSLPIRVTTGKSKSARGSRAGDVDALNSQMTLEVTFYVRWRVQHFFAFLVRIGSIGEAVRQLRDSGERSVTMEITKRTPGEVIRDLTKINEILAEALREITSDWAISIIEAAMLTPDTSYAVSDELRQVAVAKAQATQKKVTATADRFKLEEEGAGRASAIKAELEALAAGAQALEVEGQNVIELQKARAIAEGNTTIFADAGGNTSSLLGLGARLASGGGAAKKETQQKS